MGYNLKKMIYEVGGGIRGGRKLKAVVPGGSSTPVLLPEEIENLGMDFDQVGKAGSMLGSGGVVVIDDQTCMVEFALRTISFYQHESCGWCIPVPRRNGLAEEVADAVARGIRAGEGHRQHSVPGREHDGPDVLPAGRCGGDADAGICEEVPEGI